MATCGFQTPEQPKRKNRDFIHKRPKYAVRLSLVVHKLHFLVCLVLLIGCAPTLKYGSPPKVSSLESLKAGISTKADVLLALGEPRGKGAARFSVIPTPREIWFYEYTESDGSRIDLKLLLVFFDEEHYDGNLWFSSKQLLDIER
jgi:hypothetical protein